MAFASALNPTMGMDIIAEVSDTPRNSASDSTLSFYGVYRRRRAKGFASIMSLALRTMILGKLGLQTGCAKIKGKGACSKIKKFCKNKLVVLSE